MKRKDTFLRVEKKYKMTEQQYKNFLEKIKKYMTMDEYGKHTISNIYYDTEDFTLIRHSIVKPIFKEKIRLRAYGDMVFMFELSYKVDLKTLDNLKSLLDDLKIRNANLPIIISKIDVEKGIEL